MESKNRQINLEVIFFLARQFKKLVGLSQSLKNLLKISKVISLLSRKNKLKFETFRKFSHPLKFLSGHPKVNHSISYIFKSNRQNVLSLGFGENKSRFRCIQEPFLLDINQLIFYFRNSFYRQAHLITPSHFSPLKFSRISIK